MSVATSGKSEWRWLWREMRPFTGYQLASLTCILTSTSAGLVQPLLVKWLIDDILPHGRWGALALLTGLLLLSGIGRASLSSLGVLINMLAVKRMTFCMRTRLVKHVLSLSANFYTRHPVGDLLQRLERDVSLVGELGSEAMPSMARVVLETVLAVVVMVYLDWQLASIAVPLVALFGYVRHRYRVILRRGAEAVRDAVGRESSLLQEMLSGATQIQVLGAERRLSRSYARLSLRTMQREITQGKNELAFATLSMSIIGCGIGLIVGYGGLRVIRGEISLGALVAFYGYVGTIFSPMGIAIGLAAQIIRVRASIHRLMDLELASEVVRDAPDAGPLTTPPRTVTCTDLSFAYRPDKLALHGIQFHARAGERVAVVGESGCGKSSLLRLIARIHDPAGGRILIDGRDIGSIQIASLRQAIGFVPQDPVLFQGTLRQNLRYAAPTCGPEEIAEAAWIACLTEVVDRLPHGWDTELGPMGVGLSGGEKQRLAIARALLQRRPILILDEASSALDGPTESRLLSRLESWSAGRLVIVVSHRLAAARWADRVLVLHRGEVVEEGCHRTLARPGTRYAALWQLGTTPQPTVVHQ
jgi:ABC-type multidrug transport system fused ATPase/permease subunit